MKIWLTLFKQELRQIFIKDGRRAMYLFGASLTYLALFSLLYGNHVVSGVPTVILDESQTQLSRSMVQAFEDSEKFSVIGYTSSPEESKWYLSEKKAFAAITIPATFAKEVRNGLESQVMVQTNGSNIVIANTVLTSAQEIVSTFVQNISAQLMASSGQLISQAATKTTPVKFTYRVLHNPTLSYQCFFVIGLAMAALQQGIFLSAGAGMVELYNKLPDFAGIPSGIILVGKLFSYWLCGSLAFGITLGAAQQIFGLPIKGSLSQLLCLGAGFSFAAAALSSLVAAACRTEVSYTQLSLTYTVPAFVFSGHIWPIQAMDSFSQMISYAFPLTYFADSVRAIMITGCDPHFYRNLTILLATGLLLIICSLYVLDRRRNTSACNFQKFTV